MCGCSSFILLPYVGKKNAFLHRIECAALKHYLFGHNGAVCLIKSKSFRPLDKNSIILSRSKEEVDWIVLMCLLLRRPFWRVQPRLASPWTSEGRLRAFLEPKSQWALT